MSGPDSRCVAKRGPLPCLWNMSSKNSRRSCIVLSGKGRFFDVRDIITLEDMGRGVTRITYIAQFSYRFGLEHLARRQTAGLKKMGAPVFRVGSGAG